MKQLSEQQITNLRNLFHGRGTRELFDEMMKSLYKQGFDIKPVFDWHIAYWLTDINEFVYKLDYPELKSKEGYKFFSNIKSVKNYYNSLIK